jgi:putative sterol carrier protein
VTGSVRIEIEDGRTWHLSTSDGHLQIIRGARPADCVVRARAADLLDIYQGTKTPNVAALQGNLEVEGDLALTLTWGALLAAAGANAAQRPRSPM